jgi:hypothetical protein
MFDLPKRPDRSLKLFEVEENWRQCGYIYRDDRGKWGSSVWDVYADGYLEVVKCLLKAVERNEFRTDTFGYPIFFLVHQYLELRMKEIIRSGRILSGDNTQFQKGHDLTQLWGECKKILKELDEWKDYSELDNEARQNYLTLDHFINEMNQDQQGQSFRYPVDRKGNPLLNDPSIQALNVKNLATVFEWASTMLEGISIGIGEVRDVQAECRAEFEGEDYS